MIQILLSLLLLTLTAAALPLHQVPPTVTLDSDRGETANGKPWVSRDTLKGKVHILFYVDPDKKDLNNALSEALKRRKFDHNHYASVAIVNMAATWMPNFAIEAKLKKKQELYPDTLYVKDKQKVLVKEWGLADDNSDILLFDKEGKLIYFYEGRLNDKEIAKVIKLIEERLQ